MSRSYKTRYSWAGVSINGLECEIEIQQDGWTDGVTAIRLGSSPILSLSDSGRMHVMSLKMSLETTDDDQYLDLYTTDPFKFKVIMRFQPDGISFIGYVATELYSAKEISPPFDVEVTAVSTIALAKDKTFGDAGIFALSDILKKTIGQASEAFENASLKVISSITADGYSYSAANFFDKVYINLAPRNSKMSCYKMLESFLEWFGAELYEDVDSSWILIREADMNDKNMLPTFGSFPIRITSASEAYGNWPVGSLSSKIRPARMSVTVTSSPVYASKPLSYSSDSTGSEDGDGYYVLPPGGKCVMRSTFSSKISGSQAPVGKWNALLSLQAGCVATGITSDKADALSLKFTVRLNSNRWLWNGSDGDKIINGIRYNSMSEQQRGGTFLPSIKRASRSRMWLSSSTSFDKNVGYASGDKESAMNEINVIIPYPIDETTVTLNSILITIDNTTGYPILIKDFPAMMIEQESDGTEVTLTVDNSAVSAAESIECSVPEITYLGQDGFIKNVLLYCYMVGSMLPLYNPINLFSSAHASNCSLAELIGRDCAYIDAMPRKIISGTINFDLDHDQSILNIIDTTGGQNISYRVLSFDWDILESEYKFEALSLPVCSVEDAVTAEAKGASDFSERRLSALEAQMAAIMRLFGLN